MNIEKLRAMDGLVVRLRPSARRQLPNGWQLDPADDEWRIETRKVMKGAIARLHCPATGHFFDLFADGVQEYREPGFLVLREQLTIIGRTIVREPLADRRLAYVDA